MMSQSGVSHALRNLRALVNDPLFVRTPTGMIPSALTERVSIRVNFALNEMQDVLSVRSEFDPATTEAHVTIGLLSTPPMFVAGLCRVIQDRAPGISLAFRMITPDIMPEMVDNRLVDIAIGAPDPDHMDHRRRFTYDELFRDDLVCVVGRDNPRVGQVLASEPMPGCAICSGSGPISENLD